MNNRIVFRWVSVIILLILSISCIVSPESKPSLDNPTKAAKESLDNQNWVIFTEDAAEETDGAFEMAALAFKSDGFWTPTVDDVLDIEGKILEYLEANADKFYWQPPIWQRLDGYQRQYFGLERGDSQIIFGNFFCESDNGDWRQEFVFSIDGGECYFQVEYDVDSQLLIKLRVNGES